MSAGLSPLEAAKERFTIPVLWHLLNLPGRPGKRCRSPFREDRNPSFSVYEDGLKWRDHATGQGGDVADFLAAACDLSPDEACRNLIELAGVLPPERTDFPRDFVRSHEGEAVEKARNREGWPILEMPTEAEIKAVAELRGLSIEGVSLAVDRGLLFCADSREGRAWVVSDSRRISAQARRLDGRPWGRINAKAWTLPGSEAAWPIGLREASPFPAIALVEGGPDLLAAFHLTVAHGVSDRISPVAMLGASYSIPGRALPFFAGKRVRIFQHEDDAGRKAAKRWARQLKSVAGQVDGFAFDSGDLNDFVRKESENHAEAMAFAGSGIQSTDDIESLRIAGELVKMHEAGAIRGSDDPEAGFFANVIHKFQASFVESNQQKAVLAA